MLISMNTVLYHKEKERSGAVIHGFSLSLSHTHTPTSMIHKFRNAQSSVVRGFTHKLTHKLTHTHTLSHSPTSMVHTLTHTLFYFHGTHTLTLFYFHGTHTHTHTLSLSLSHSSASMVHTRTYTLSLFCFHGTHTHTHAHALLLPWYCYLPDLQVQECPALCLSLPGLWHLCCSRVCATGPTVLSHHSGLLG